MKKFIKFSLMTLLTVSIFCISCKSNTEPENEFKATQVLSSEITKIDDTTYQFGYFAQTKLENTDGLKFSPKTAENGWYIGSDGNYYGKAGDDYFKVEPIVWKVYTDKFNHNDCYTEGTDVILLAENVLYAGIPYSESEATVTRTVQGKEVYTNSYVYSNLRAFFNGYDYYCDDGTISTKYKVENFLNMAFTSNAQSKILATVVKNDAASSNDISNSGWTRNDGTIGNDTTKLVPLDTLSGYPNITEADTNDKVFAFSLYDFNNLNYGWAKGGSGTSAATKKTPTEFAIALGAKITNGYTRYMERTPHYNTTKTPLYERVVDETGYNYISVPISDSSVGIVPAITLAAESLQ